MLKQITSIPYLNGTTTIFKWCHHHSQMVPPYLYGTTTIYKMYQHLHWLPHFHNHHHQSAPPLASPSQPTPLPTVRPPAPSRKRQCKIRSRSDEVPLREGTI